ncbi:MAG: hypothetical protein Q8P20_05425 [bacterium]|nr:hypothetical protein [bacterium]
MAGYVMKMSNLVSNINHRGQKDLPFEVRHKVYARPLACKPKMTIFSRNSHIKTSDTVLIYPLHRHGNYSIELIFNEIKRRDKLIFK